MRKKVGGSGQRILELSSPNIDGTQPVPVTLQPKTHVNVVQVAAWQHTFFIYLGRRHEVHALFRHPLHVLRVSHSHSREVEDNHKCTCGGCHKKLQLKGLI